MSNPSIKYAIAAGHHLTAEVAQLVLEDGGNAFDAAVAAYLTMFLSEPVMASAGAGGFANIHIPDKGNFILDFFCQTPFKKNTTNPNFEEITVDFGQSQEVYYAGPATMAVPGSIALISFLSKHYCSIPLKELCQPVIRHAKQGLKLTWFQAEDIILLKQILKLSDTGKELFFKDDMPKEIGELVKMPDYADFLESYGREEPDWFYHGEIAQGLVEYSIAQGGNLSMDDFTNYAVQVCDPLQFDFYKKRISVPDLPSMGGGLQYLFLKFLSAQTATSALDKIHFDQLRKGFQHCFPVVGNASDLNTTLNAHFPNRISNANQNPIPGGTSHFNIIDGKGNAIALSTSIGEGCGYFIPGTQMQMNNMLGETALLPNGLSSWIENTRLNSMMCPTLVFNESNKVVLATGSGGATRIPFSIGQLLYNRFGLNLPLNDAIHLPRIYENKEHLYIESGFDLSEIQEDKDKRIWDELQLLFGGTHSIDLESEQAVGDSRREGIGVYVKK